jgi:hypothetical protein
MRRAPRNVNIERLVDARLVLYAYVFIAAVESLLCVGAFFLAMAQKGFPIGAVLYNREFVRLRPRALEAARKAGSAHSPPSPSPPPPLPFYPLSPPRAVGRPAAGRA